jgi:hypothetical protein
VHDRRIDGVAHTFGNQGALYKSAMTWWDHETGSVWSQPTGLGLFGSYQGVRLAMVPAGVTSWGAWKREHGDTLVLVDPLLQRRRAGSRVLDTTVVQSFKEDIVVGIALGDSARAFPFQEVSKSVVVNDAVGPFPVLVYASAQAQSIHVYSRQAQGRILTFAWEGGQLRDVETNSAWDVATGVAGSGPMKGVALRPIPYSSAYAWAWLGFYPHSSIYGE